MRTSFRVLWSLPLVLAAATLSAQGNAGTSLPSATSVKATAGGKRALTIAEYGRWRAIGSVAIADDGTWATWSYTQRNVDDTLFVKNLETDAVTRIPRASAPQFSDDARW